MPNLTSIISSQISDLYGDIGFFPSLSAPPKSEHGEYCFGVFTLAKPISKAPNIIAEEIAAELRKDIMYFTQVNVIGGYVNFSCTSGVWIDIFSDIQKNKIEKKGETIIIDYIGANIGKPLHIGHLCTPSIGQTIYNVYSYLGYRVIGDSHFCDWGGILGKLIAGGKEDSKNNTIELLESVENKGVDYLLEIYQNTTKTIEKEKLEGKSDFDTKSREEFRKLTQGDVENIELWKNFTKISVAEIEKKLDLLNVHATYNIGESFYEGLNLPRPNNEDYPALTYKMKDIVTELIEKGVAKQNDDGSVGVSFPEETKMPSCILQKKDGTGLYLTSDLGAIKYRLTNGWNPTKIIYSVDVRQQLHLKQAFWIAQKAWPELTEGVEFFHAFNGFIKLKEGAMSTRHGTVIFLEKLLEEGNEKTQKILEEKGRVGDRQLQKEDIQAITVGAIKYSYLAQDREKDVTFDWDKALNFEGNSGPYIQYACVRAMKIVPYGFNDYTIVNDIILSPYDKTLIQTLARFDEVVNTTAKSYKPHHLALYCYDLAVCFNSFYVHTPKILEEADENLKNLRLNLCKLTSEKLILGFELLGIKMPTEM